MWNSCPDRAKRISVTYQEKRDVCLNVVCCYDNDIPIIVLDELDYSCWAVLLIAL